MVGFVLRLRLLPVFASYFVVNLSAPLEVLTPILRLNPHNTVDLFVNEGEFGQIRLA